MKRSGDSVLQAHGLTSQQWTILLHLASDPNLPLFQNRKKVTPVIASELAAAFMVSRANISNLLTALLEKKLIFETEDEMDRRRKIFMLTESGKKVVQEISPKRQIANQELFANFTEEEKNQFLNFIQRCMPS